jgi:copper chaperone CopZ
MMRISPLRGALVLIVATLAACGSTPEKEVDTKTEPFVFHVVGILGRPGMFTEEMSTSINDLLREVDGVQVVKATVHPGNRLDNHVTVRYDPEVTDRETIASAVGALWEISWYACDRCGKTYGKRQICCGRQPEEYTQP